MPILPILRRLSFALAFIFTTAHASAQAYGLTSRPSVGAYLDGVMPATPPTLPTNWSTVVAFPNLTFLNPLGLLPMPGTNKLVVWEREGRIYHFDNAASTATKTLIVDFSSVCQGWDDSGLLGIAFHPNFNLSGVAGTNRYLFVWYNHTRPGTAVIGNASTRPDAGQDTINRLSRFMLDANGVAVAGSETVIIEQYDSSVWHNGGGMFFHPVNGFLYITNGDDADGANDQRIDTSLFSGVLRIDVDKRGGAISHAPAKRAVNENSPNWPQYYIPNDNPFVGVPNALEEFYAIGLRSPHRMTIDPPSGRIFIGDVGEGTREEISVIEPNDPPGLNLQWNRIEGYNGDLTQPYIGVNKRPMIDYFHGQDGAAVIGGYVYRGSEFPELAGKYIFGDNISNRVWALDESTHTATTPASKVLLTTLPKGAGPNSGNDYVGLSSFGIDANGELYLCQLSSTAGKIYKLQRGGPAPTTPLPARLSQIDAFSDLATLTPSAKLIPYALNTPFWSDGAVKTRWATVPNATTVGFNATGEWTWPEGSVLVKHFELPVDDTNPTVRKRLETRFIVKMASGAVYGASYKWRADNSDADLMDSALTENIPIAIPPPGTFVGADIGAPTQAGSTTRVGDEVTITAGGTDIWNTSDQFHFAYQQRIGDFDVSVHFTSLSQADLYTKAGLMARESLAAGSRHVFALVFPSNAARNNNNGGYEFQYRASTNGPSVANYPAVPQPTVNFPNAWLRFRRQGDTFIGFSSVDGVMWSEFARQTLALPSTVYFGLAAASHTAIATTTAKVLLQNTRIQPWYYPSRSDCITCHNTNAGGVLGPKTRQLNGDLLYPNAVTDNQLRSWAHVGLFSNPPAEAEIPNLDKLAALGDGTASVEKRARSYLDANCASCHRPGGVQAFWDARYDTPLTQQGIIYGAVGNNLGDPSARVVVPQDLVRSIMHRRASTVGGGIQMPPLAKNMVDQAGVNMLANWINSLIPNIPPVVTLTAPANGNVYLQSQTINLAATASDADGILKVEFYDGATKIGEDTTAPYQYAWTGALRGTHTLTALAIDNFGNNTNSAPVTVSVQGALLPSPWAHSDIGAVNLDGDASYAGGAFTVSGAGDDIWGTADGFHFVYRAFTGDGEMIARVVYLDNTDGWAKAGVMMRGTLAANSTYAISAITPGNGAAFQRRITTGGDAVHTAGAGVAAPYWVRLVRVGDVFTAYSSPDGITWTAIGNETIAMGATVYAGLAVTAHNNGLLAEAVFDNVAFVSAGSPAFSAKINFQPAAAAVPAGYLVDSGAVFGVNASGLSYGWNTDKSAAAVDRNSGNAPDQRYDTLITMGNAGSGATWELQVPNAHYQVRVVAGDPTSPNGTQHVTIEGPTLINAATNATTRFRDATGTFNVTNGKLTLALGASAANTKVCFIEVTSYDVASNIAPVVALSSPADGAVFYNPASITLNALTADADTPVSKVEFFVDGGKIGEDTTAPFSFAWTPPVYGTHALTARATDAGGGVGDSQPATITVNTPNVAGFRGEYYDNMDFTNLVMVRADNAVNFDWGTGSPDARMDVNTYSVRWSARISPRYSETYTFTTTTDDGVRLWVNGQLLVDHFVDQGATSWTGTIALTANQGYDLMMEYYENGGDASAKLYWSSASQAQEIIPASRATVPPPPNLRPSVTLTAPGDNTAFLPGDAIALAATATDPDGSIARVEFWADGVKLGQNTVVPFTWNWPGPRSTGAHIVWAMAFDDGGVGTSSSVANVQSIPLTLIPVSMQHLTNPDRVSSVLETSLPVGRTYVIEWSADLAAWTPLQSGTSSGALIQVTDVAAGVAQRFYRIRITN